MVIARKIIIAIFVMLLVLPIVIAQEPELNIYADRLVYGAGDSGLLILELNTYGVMREAEIEVVILSPENVIVDGAIIYTKVPEVVNINKDTWQTEQTVLKEGLEFLQEERTVLRKIDFTIPQAAPTGDYKVKARVVYIGGVLEEEGVMGVVGGGVVDAILGIYVIIIFVMILAIIHREMFNKVKIKKRRKR